MYPSAADFSIFAPAPLVEAGLDHLKTTRPPDLWFIVPEIDYSDRLEINQEAARRLSDAMLLGRPWIPNMVLRAALLTVARRATEELNYDCRMSPELPGGRRSRSYITLTARPV